MSFPVFFVVQCLVNVVFALLIFTLSKSFRALAESHNRAVHNFRKEWNTWRLNRDQDFELFQQGVRDAMSGHIREHIEMLETSSEPRKRSQHLCNCGLALGHLPAIYCTNPGPRSTETIELPKGKRA